MKRTAWHCPNGSILPTSSLCPECQERRRAGNRRRQAEYRQANAVSYSGHLPGLQLVNCARGKRKAWHCKNACTRPLSELCPACAGRMRARYRKTKAHRRAVEQYVASG